MKFLLVLALALLVALSSAQERKGRESYLATKMFDEKVRGLSLFEDEQHRSLMSMSMSMPAPPMPKSIKGRKLVRARA
jgi:hypothetical protein